MPQAPALADNDPARRAAALGDYRRYLRLAVGAPSLAPGAAIDLAWHAHMCLPACYAADMRALGAVGRSLARFVFPHPPPPLPVCRPFRNGIARRVDRGLPARLRFHHTALPSPRRRANACARTTYVCLRLNLTIRFHPKPCFLSFRRRRRRTPRRAAPLPEFIDHRPCSEDYPADPRWLDNSREAWKAAFGPDAIFPGEYTGIVKCCCGHFMSAAEKVIYDKRNRLSNALHVELTREWASALAAGGFPAVATAMVNGLEDPGRAWITRASAPKYAEWADETNGVGNTPEAAKEACRNGDELVASCVKRIAMRDPGLSPWYGPERELKVPGHAESKELKQSVPHATLAALMRAVAGSPKPRRAAALRVLAILGLSVESYPPWDDAELRALRAAADGMTCGQRAAACAELPKALVAIVDEELAARDPLRAASQPEAPKAFCPGTSCELM